MGGRILGKKCKSNELFDVHKLLEKLTLDKSVVAFGGKQSKYIENLGFPAGRVVKNLPTKQEMWVQSLGQEYPLEKEISTRSSIFAW